MSGAPAAAKPLTTFSGNVTASCGATWLRELAEALGINLSHENGRKIPAKDLVPLIKAQVNARAEELQEQPRFAGLYAYRAADAPKEGPGRKNGRTSAQKARDDRAEDKKQRGQPPTGQVFQLFQVACIVLIAET